MGDLRLVAGREGCDMSQRVCGLGVSWAVWRSFGAFFRFGGGVGGGLGSGGVTWHKRDENKRRVRVGVPSRVMAKHRFSQSALTDSAVTLNPTEPETKTTFEIVVG